MGANDHKRRKTEKMKGGDMMAKKENCGCGCVPPGKMAKRKVKSEKAKKSKKK